MAVKIRLKRIGMKKHPFYRVVVTDERTGREAHRIFMTQEMQRWKPVLAAAGETLD